MLGLPAPNPCQVATTFDVTLAAPQMVRVIVADALGRTIRLLFDDARSAGEHSLAWDLRDAGGRPVPAGVYWLRLEPELGRTIARKVVVEP
jgi:hypothetical protein